MFNLKELISLPEETTLNIAYSGGLDSHVLLHSLVKFQRDCNLQYKIHVVHINHQLSPNATEWTKHCEKICHDLQVPLQIYTVDARSTNGQSPEASAREARYQALLQFGKKGDYVVTAHHRDDQAETVLIRLIRGAGPKGLASIPSLTVVKDRYLWRPFLLKTRKELLDYAKFNGLNWIEDESNTNPQFDRNFIRHEIMPLLQKRWPSVDQTFARAATYSSEVDSLLDDLAEKDLEVIATTSPNIISIDQLLKFNYSRQRNVLRYWLQKLNFPVPTQVQMQHLERDVLSCAEDANPTLRFGRAEIRRYRNRLYVMSHQPPQPSLPSIQWDLSGELDLPVINCRLKIQGSEGQGLRLLTEEERNHCSIRFRKGGEICHPVGRVGSHPLKKLWQEWGVPPWERSRIPLLFYGEELISVIGYCYCSKYAAKNNEKGWHIEQISIE